MSVNRRLWVGIKSKIHIENTADPVVLGLASIQQQASPQVVTSAAHGLANNDWVRMCVPDGMADLDGQIGRVQVVDPTTFTLEGVNTTDYDALTNGAAAGFFKILTWASFNNVKKWDLPEGDPARLDDTDVHKGRQTRILGMAGFQDGSMVVKTDFEAEAMQLVKTYTESGEQKGQRVINRDGRVIAVNSEWSGGEGMSLGVNEISESQIAFTVIGRPVAYPALTL